MEFCSQKISVRAKHHENFTKSFEKSVFPGGELRHFTIKAKGVPLV